MDSFLQPIMNAVGIDEKNVFVVAGNHEVKRTGIASHIEAGLHATLTSENNIDDFLANIDSESQNALSILIEISPHYLGMK